MENIFNGKKLAVQVVLINVFFPLFFVQLSQSLIQIYNPALEGSLGIRLSHSFKPTILLLFLVAVVFAVLIIGRILNPLINYFKEGSDYERARKATISVPWILMGVHSILWILSNFAFYMAYQWQTPGGVPFFWSLSLSVLSGLIGALFSSLTMNVLFVPVKSLLKMTSRNKGEEDLFLRNKNLIIVGIVILSSVLFTSYAGRYYAVSSRDNGISYPGTVILLSLISVGVALVLILLSRYEDRMQVRLMAEKLRELNEAGGDLTGKLILINFDENGDLAEEINRLMEKLHVSFSEVAGAAGDMLMISHEIDRSIDSARSRTGEILESSREVDSFLSEQRSVVNRTGEKLGEMLKGFECIFSLVEEHREAVDSTSSTIEEMTANIKSVTENTETAKEITDQLGLSIRDGNSAVNTSISCIEGILETSGKMNELVRMIGKVAAQTNMLAMNAAIEAAHAGDKGLGFAVVADEVRKLAGTSAENTGEIAGNIQMLNEKVETGVQTSRSAGDILTRIMNEINRSELLSGEIAAAMSQQRSGTEELLRVVNNVVSTSSNIQDETSRQVQENTELKENITNFIDQCARIQTLTNSQLDSYQVVSDSLASLKGLSEKGKQLGDALESVISGFTL